MDGRSIANAWRVFADTLPAASARLTLALGLWLAFVTCLVAGALIGRALSSFPNSYGGSGAAFLALLFLAALARFRYRLSCSFGLPCLAILAARIVEGRAASEANVLAAGQSHSEQVFGDRATFEDFDKLLIANLKFCTRMMGELSAYLQFPGFTGFVALAGLLLRQAAADMRMALLIYVFNITRGNPWETLRQGLVLYMQNAIRLTKNAFAFWAAAWVSAVILYLVLRAPIRGLFTLLPAEIYSFSGVAAFGLAFALKIAVIDVLAGLAFTDLFNREAGIEIPDPAWEKRMTEESAPFRDLKSRSMQGFRFPL